MLKGLRFLLIGFLSLGFYTKAFASENACDRFNQFIKAKKIKSVDSLLHEMKDDAEWAEFLKHYTFAFKSKSLQKATAQEPRAIVYGSDGKMVMTFVAKADTNGRDAVELMCWRENQHRFEFYELDFLSNKKLSLDSSTANPSRCLSCHGADPRPNFEAYNTWSGMFGSLSRNGCSLMVKAKPEFELYQKFLYGNRYLGRYAALPREIADDTAGVYGASCAGPADGSVANFRNATSMEPNAEMLDHLTPLNNLRIGRIISSNSSVKFFVPALRALRDYKATMSPDSAGSCRDIEAYFPEPVRLARKNVFDTYTEIKKRAESEFAYRLRSFYLFNADVDSPDYPGQLEPINFLVKEERVLRRFTAFKYILDRMGVDFSRLTMGFDSGTYDLVSNRFSIDKSLDAIIDAVLANLGESPSVTPNPNPCEERMKLSLASLKNYQVPPSSQSKLVIETTPISLERQTQLFSTLNSVCLRCHGVTQVDLPFHSPGELKSALRLTPDLTTKIQERILGINLYGKAQMPLGAPFETSLQLELVNYLEQLRN